jgi:hypothetical protein
MLRTVAPAALVLELGVPARQRRRDAFDALEELEGDVVGVQPLVGEAGECGVGHSILHALGGRRSALVEGRGGSAPAAWRNV